MTKFENAPFNERFKDLGDTAEGAFEQWAEKNGVAFVRIGFNRPPFRRFYKFDERLRLMPDYACEGNDAVLIEVKGCGNEGLKIKLESLDVMLWWNELQTTNLFVYNSARPRRYTFLTVAELIRLTEGKDVHKFPDGKPYYLIPNDEIETWETWTP